MNFEITVRLMRVSNERYDVLFLVSFWVLKVLRNLRI
ncbi:hypothetical protein GGD55_002989 [Rhizobium giardinii]|uniref:Uncharacterized protein n=1 Tax=Rhizobium giardinii TaxID=56731 RepID=A0A7W8X960_9HYPH|nr:hypothetical protein [Rhizobium giardinii]